MELQRSPFWLRSLIAIAAASSLAACGGGGGGSAPSTGGMNALPVAPNTYLTPPPISNPVPITTGGTVAGVFGGGFQLNTGSPHGLIEIYTTSSTTVTGPAPYVGESVSVSGNGNWSQAIIATSVTLAQTAAVTSPVPVSSTAPSAPSGPAIAVPQGIVSTQGSVAGFRTGGLTLDQGAPAGKIPVMTSGANVIGGPVAVGSTVQISGTGSIHTGMTATVITVVPAPATTTTASGTIAAATAYGFTLNVDASHTAVPIILNSTVLVAGGSLQVGSKATVTGPGSIALSITPVQIVVSNPTPPPAPNATPTPTPGPIAQAHVLSADYWGAPYGTTSVPAATAARYIDWAEVSAANANTASANGIKTEFYMNPNRAQTNDPMYTSDATTFATDCSSNRVTTVYNGITQYVMDVRNASTQSLYASVVASRTAGAHYDAIFEDDAGALSAYTGLSGTPCNYNDASWLSGEEAMEASVPIPTIFNGLSALNGHSPSSSLQLLSQNAAMGGNFEHCYSDDGQPESSNWLWVATENTELSVANQHKIFQCMARNTSSAATQTAARLYAYASFLLTYDPNTSVYWNYYATPSNLHVMPEQQLVALNPVISEPSDVSALMTSGGAYGREYRTCYIATQFVGPCAVAVNPDSSSSHTFPFPQYTHTLSLSGAGLLDGGTMSTAGPASALYMPPSSAVIAFP